MTDEQLFCCPPYCCQNTTKSEINKQMTAYLVQNTIVSADKFDPNYGTVPRDLLTWYVNVDIRIQRELLFCPITCEKLMRVKIGLNGFVYPMTAYYGMFYNTRTYD